MKNLLLLTLVAVFMAACNGGGNGGGAPGYSHNDLADKFVRDLNLEPGFDVTLVKSSTLISDYIVIYDPYTGTYDAIDIYSYDPAYDNAADYYYDTSYSHYYGLVKVPGHYEYYYDYDAYGNLYLVEDWVPTRYHGYGLVFEKTEATPKDLAKIAAISEVAEIEKTAQFLASSEGLGLSLSRAKEVARLKANWKKASLKAMTDKELDAFSTELLGFSITSAKKAVKDSLEGNSTSIKSLVNKAAETNGITPEHAQKLKSKTFGL